MQIQPYLMFLGNCREALAFYAEVLGGQVEGLVTYAEAPPEMKMAPELAGQVMNATLRIGEQRLMASDSPPQWWEKPQGTWIAISVDDPAEAERIFSALSEGGQVRMPLEPTFWADRFGMVVDRFGTSWMVNGGSRE